MKGRYTSICLFIALIYLVVASRGISAEGTGYTEVISLGRGAIRDVSWQLNGDMFAVASTHGIWVYRSDFTDVVHLATDSNLVFNDIEWSPSGDHLVAVSQSGQQDVVLWSLNMEQEVWYSTVLSDGTNAVSWSPDSTQLVTALQNSDGTNGVAFWNVETGEQTRAFLSAQPINALAWSPDGTRLAVSSTESIQILDIATGEIIQVWDDKADTMKWSPDGTILATAYRVDAYETPRTNSLRLWHVDSDNPHLQLVIQAGEIADFAWSPDGSRIVTGNRAFGSTAIIQSIPAVEIWNTNTGELVLALPDHQGAVISVAWTSNGNQLITAGSDNRLYLWDVSADQAVLNQDMGGYMGRVTDLSWSPDGRYIASGSVDGGGVRIWNVDTGQVQGYLVGNGAQGHENRRVQSVAWNPMSNLIVTGGEDLTVRLWNGDTGAWINTFIGHEFTAYSRGAGLPSGIADVTWNPDGTLFASGGYDATARLWDERGANALHVLEGTDWPVTSLAWSMDGELLYGAGSAVMAWDIASGHPLDDFPCATEAEGYTSVVASPDGRYLAFSSRNQGYVCDLTDGSRLTNRSVGAVMDWHPLRQELVDIVEGVVRIVDPFTSEPIAEITDHSGVIEALWNPDGSLLATGSIDGTIKIWTSP